MLTQFSRPPGSDKRTLAEFGFPPAVYPLGRLDYESEGLLLLTDDRHLNQLLLHPQWQHERTYLAQVEHVPDDDQLALIRGGVLIEGRKTMPAAVMLLAGEPELPPRPAPIRFRKNIPTAWLELTLVEGRNRQVRKMTAAAGCPTLRLVRTAVGALKLTDLHLAPGEWMSLSPAQLRLALM